MFTLITQSCPAPLQTITIHRCTSSMATNSLAANRRHADDALPQLHAPLLKSHDHDSVDGAAANNPFPVFLCKAMKKIMITHMNAATSSFRRAVLEVMMKDTAKTIHSLKMALALVLAFLLVLLRAPYNQLGSHAIWAIMTVVVVFEFTIGATLSKGLNRGVGTMMAGLLAMGVGETAACISGGLAHPLLIAFSVFLVGGVVTFAKLLPTLKPYEFGFRSFLLTFSLIMAAEYRGGDPLGTAINRFLVILLGAAIGISINVFLFPNWAGDDLHTSLVSNFYGVADALEACVNEYLRGTILERVPSKVFMGKPAYDPVYKGYRSTLSSASREESLAGFASWEPPHGRFTVVKYPWHQYVKVGAVLRHCAYSVVALHGCLQSAIQAPLRVRKLFEIEIRAVGSECALALRKLGRQLEHMKKGDFASLLQGVEHSIDELQQSLYHRSYLLVRKEQILSEENAEKVAVSVVTRLMHENGRNRHHLSSNNLTLKYASEEFSHFSKQRCLKRIHSWPSRLKDSLDNAKEPLLERKVRVVESASALSVGTFATLLMEVALRLTYVVDTVCELGELASFSDMKEENDVDDGIQVNGYYAQDYKHVSG